MYHSGVIRRLYIHNYRCLENFDLPISDKPSVLLIGKNGSGKTTVGLALEVLQKIARGTNRVGELVRPRDFPLGRTDAPMRFEIEVQLKGKLYAYSVAFELPTAFKELRVSDESLRVDDQTIYSRKIADVVLPRSSRDREAKFSIDWHLVALPIIQQSSDKDPIAIFRAWLGKMIIIRPIPSMIRGLSDTETLQPNSEVTDFAAWFSGLVAYAPAAYARIAEYLRRVMPDLSDIQNPQVAPDSRSLTVRYASDQGTVSIPFDDLSDGEKCFMISALVLASNQVFDSVFCFWDEPDNYLALDEVGHFTMELRKTFEKRGQLIATSHNPETIRRFSDENTLVLYRRNHLEPTVARPLSDFQIKGDRISALLTGDLNP